MNSSDAVALASLLTSCSIEDSQDTIFTVNDNTLEDVLSKRLKQGKGEVIWELGVSEQGSCLKLSLEEFQASLCALKACADSLDAEVTLLHTRRSIALNTSMHDLTPIDESKYYYGHALIRKRITNVSQILELRICVIGNVDAGKSTLLGVLTKNVLDDGRGKARISLFKHKHEIESGRTSSIGMEMMAFDSKATIISPKSGKTKLNWDDVCIQASKVITFIDLAGHEKYLKTTVFGMSGNAPDYCMLMIGSNSGVIGMTKEHLGLALALQLPVFIVVTKIDLCPKNILEATIQQLVKVLRSSGCRKIPMFINSIDDVLMTATNFVSERICPIFQVSNVIGTGLDNLKLFLNILQINYSGKYDVGQPFEYHITDTFSVPGVGTVVAGTIISGIIYVGDTMLLGPDFHGNFIPAVIKSIQRKRVNVQCASAGQSVSFGLKKIKKSFINKGMILAGKNLEPKAVYEFEAEILVLYHSTTIGKKYQAMVHCGCVRQQAQILKMDKEFIRTGDRALVNFKFMQKPEYLKIGSRLIFREGRTKGVGRIVNRKEFGL